MDTNAKKTTAQPLKKSVKEKTEELKTEGPIIEKDEVKKAESKMNKGKGN